MRRNFNCIVQKLFLKKFLKHRVHFEGLESSNHFCRCLRGYVRVRSFLILGTGAEDFWQGYETFFHNFVGVRKYIKSNFYGVQNYLVWKNFRWKHWSKIERKINRHLEMMNHLISMKIARDNLVSFHRSMFFAQRLLDGVLNHFAEGWWGTKTVSMFKMGYEIFSNCVKLSSALVPRIKNDRSLSSFCFLHWNYNACQKSLEHLGHFFIIRISNHSHQVQIPPRRRNNVDFEGYCPSIPAESRIVLSCRFFDHNTTLFWGGEGEIAKQGKICRGVPRLLAGIVRNFTMNFEIPSPPLCSILYDGFLSMANLENLFVIEIFQVLLTTFQIDISLWLEQENPVVRTWSLPRKQTRDCFGPRWARCSCKDCYDHDNNCDNDDFINIVPGEPEKSSHF